ncbi:MAG: low temperature requirement protein A, partial [Solirubrobacterales bacterium]|nr:low temperature requirement protein A [Solirubrobacterales bacterium]
LLLATMFILITGLALPQAFTTEGTLFAVSYSAVRLLHLVLYADASRRGNAAWSAIAGFAVTVVLGMALLIVGSLLHGTARELLWLIAVAIDYAGPAGLTRNRLRELQRVAVAHFAERYGLFVIICLGESIVTIGVGARGRALDAALVGAVALGLLITVGLWWTYFDRAAAQAERGLAEHPDPVLAAADGYSYIHLLIVAGIIVFVVGVNVVVHAPSEPPGAGGRLALCGGVAVYLLAHAAFILRVVGARSFVKLAVAAALLVLYAVGGGLSGWEISALTAALLTALCIAEFRSDLAGKHGPSGA